MVEAPYMDKSISELLNEFNLTDMCKSMTSILNAVQNIITAESFKKVLFSSELSDASIISHYKDASFNFLALESLGVYDVYQDTLCVNYGLGFDTDNHKLFFSELELSISDEVRNSVFVGKTLREIDSILPFSDYLINKDCFTKHRNGGFSSDLYLPDYHALLCKNTPNEEFKFEESLYE